MSNLTPDTEFMKNPVRTVESKHNDVVTFDFGTLTITTRMNDGSEPDTESVPDRKTMWRKLRETRAAFADPNF